MSYQATVFKVMIASPGDVNEEREIIREVISEWNTINADSKQTVLLPVGWDTHSSPAMGDRPQAIINKQVLKDCDLLVGVFWTRLGTPTGEYLSGTIEEIEEHIKAGKPAMLYFSSAPVLPDSIDAEQYAKLKEFKESCKTRGIFEIYDIPKSFKEKFNRQLQLKLIQDEYFKLELARAADTSESVAEIRVPQIPELSKEAQVLLHEASQDPDGHILRLSTMGGFIVATNGKEMVSDDNPRNRATWESTISELETLGLIQDRGNKREVFGITRNGYEFAELINQ